MPLIRCPICEQSFDVAHSTTMPFCSQRCKEIDMRRWLTEGYGLPIERDEEPELKPDDE